MKKEIEKVVQYLINKQCFDFYVMDFLIIPKRTPLSSASSKNTIEQTISTKILIFNGLKCHHDPMSSSCFLRNFISPHSNMLYIPLITHPNIKKITLPTFFHLCRLQNISFDIEKKWECFHFCGWTGIWELGNYDF